MRIKVHGVFDKWWRDKKIKRTQAYKKLAHYMSLRIQETHIGHFSIEQCENVIKFVMTESEEQNGIQCE